MINGVPRIKTLPRLAVIVHKSKVGIFWRVIRFIRCVDSLYRRYPMFRNNRTLSSVGIGVCKKKTGTLASSTKFVLSLCIVGSRDGAVGWGNALKAGRSRFRFRMGSLGLILVDPCIVVWLSRNTNKMQLVIEFIIPKFIEGSACFERHTAHHQEL